MLLDPIKLIRAACFLNGFKVIPRKACPSGLRTMVPIDHIRIPSIGLELACNGG